VLTDKRKRQDSTEVTATRDSKDVCSLVKKRTYLLKKITTSSFRVQSNHPGKTETKGLQISNGEHTCHNVTGDKCQTREEKKKKHLDDVKGGYVNRASPESGMGPGALPGRQAHRGVCVVRSHRKIFFGYRREGDKLGV